MARRVKKKKREKKTKEERKQILQVMSTLGLHSIFVTAGAGGGTPAGRRPSISLALSPSSMGAPDDERFAGKPHLTAENVVEAQRTVRCASGRRN